MERKKYQLLALIGIIAISVIGANGQLVFAEEIPEVIAKEFSDEVFIIENIIEDYATLYESAQEIVKVPVVKAMLILFIATFAVLAVMIAILFIAFVHLEEKYYKLQNQQ